MEVDMEQKTEIQILETLEQKRETIPLYQQAFADPELFVSYYYKEKCKDNWIFVKKKANKISPFRGMPGKSARLADDSTSL